MDRRKFAKYYEKYYVKDKTIQRIARKMSMGDEELYNDLVQEGLQRLWIIKPEKAKKNPDAYIRQCIKFAMVDFLRHNDPERYESLDSRLLAGEQIEYDAAIGELRLISHRCEVRLDREFTDHGNGRLTETDEDSYE